MTHTRNIWRTTSARRAAGGVSPAVMALVTLIFVAVGSSLAFAAGNQTRLAGASPIAANMPLCFEAYRGQADGRVRFMARGAAYQFLITPTEAVVTLRKLAPSFASPERLATDAQASLTTFRSVRLEFLGANPKAVVSGEKEMAAHVNYFIGNDPAKWQAGVPLFERVRVEDVYPGIAIVHYGNQRELEYDFIIAPHADPAEIAVRFTGADSVCINEAGELVLKLGGEEIRQPRPVIYQTVRGKRMDIDGGYRLEGERTMKFRIGDYDPSLPLTIDPVLSYSTFFGGTEMDIGWAVVVGADGNVYLAGETMSSQIIPDLGAFQTNLAGSTSLHGDAFITKLNNLMTQYDYFTYLGGKTADAALALAVDGDGNAYVAGYTDSTNFPVHAAIFTNLSGRANVFTGMKLVDAFVAKISPSGSNLLFSTYLGGAVEDAGYGIALDAQTNVYVTGKTLSTNFPTRNTVRTNQNGNGDAFVAKIDIGNTNLVYCALLGGTNLDVATDIAVDAAGDAFVTGYTSSTNFPVTNAVQSFLNTLTNLSTVFDAFAFRLDPDTDSLVYSTFLGGTNDDYGYRLALDGEQAVYVTGSTRSPDFVRSTTNLPSGVVSNASVSDVMVVKLDAAGARSYSAMFGGAGQDEGRGLAVDASGNAWIVGLTASTRFPTNGTVGSLRGTNSGGLDVFISKLNATGTALDFSAYFGGTKDDMAYDVTLDPAGNAYVVGETSSANFPVEFAGQTLFGGEKDAFVLKILEEPSLDISTVSNGVAVSWPGFSEEFSLQSSTNLSASNAWVNVSAPQVLTNARNSVTLGATNSQRFFRLRLP